MKNEKVVPNLRRPMNHTGLLALLFAATTALTAAVSDWPQFRGPNGSGIAAADAQPATTWSDSENVKWKTALPGPGSSSPIVAGERVFITCYSGYGDSSNSGSPDKLQRHLYSVSRRNGTFVIAAQPEFKLVAQNKLAGDDSDFNGTPAVVGRQLFLRSNRFLYCIESMQSAGAGKTQ